MWFSSLWCQEGGNSSYLIDPIRCSTLFYFLSMFGGGAGKRKWLILGSHKAHFALIAGLGAKMNEMSSKAAICSPNDYTSQTCSLLWYFELILLGTKRCRLFISALRFLRRKTITSLTVEKSNPEWMNEFRVRRHKIKQIFISHLHGDHIYGLIGFCLLCRFQTESAPMISSPSLFEESFGKNTPRVVVSCDSILRIRSSIGLFSKMPQLEYIPCRSFIGRRLPAFYSKKKR